MDVDQLVLEQTPLDDASSNGTDQMEQSVTNQTPPLTRPNITDDGKGILNFESYSKSKPTNLYWECLLMKFTVSVHKMQYCQCC